MSIFENIVNSTLSGSAYGISAVLLAHPFDTIKTCQQTHIKYLSFGPISTFMSIVRSEGVLALYKGFIPAASGSMLFRALPFAMYTFTSGYLEKIPWFASHSILCAALAGASGGALRSVVECPLEVAKVRCQVDKNMTWSSPRTLFTGFSITAMRNISVISLFWVLFNLSTETRKKVVELYCTPNSISSMAFAAFLGGAGCSAISWCVIYPLDVVKSRAQGGGAHSRTSSNSNLLYLARNIIDTQGWRGLYRGLSAGIVRSIVANGGAMVVYDFVSQSLKQ